jgi:lysophospholipase L1-like esterase
MGRIKAFLAVLVCAVSAAVFMVAAPPAGAAGANDYVALGDSYASGVGSRTYYGDSGSCYRSPASYPATVASAAGLALDFRACSGAKVADVVNSQLAAVNRGTDFVTVTVGGNDVNFAPVLTECAKPSWWGNCTKAVNDALVILRTQLPARLAGLYSQIRARAPYARVVVTGYPLLFDGQDCNLLTFFSSGEEAQLNAATNELDALLQSQAATAGFAFADLRAVFTGHAWCGRPEWINGLSNPVLESYHPNLSGHAAYAGVVRPALVPSGVLAQQVSVRSDMGVQTLASEAVSAPDLGSPEAAAAAKAAGVSRWQLAAIRLAQARGVAADWLDAVDQQIAARLGR